jgi:hypothetical protein
VVQDLRPFCINVHMRCFTKRGARRIAWLVSPRYFTVMTVVEAMRLDTEACTSLRDGGPIIGPGGRVRHPGWRG